MNRTERRKLRVLRDRLDTELRPLAKQATCRAGCTACCIWQVPIVCMNEAREMLPLVTEKHNLIAAVHGLLDALKQERPMENARRCVFLGDDDLCTIYGERPVSCRTHMVTSNPIFCRVYNHPSTELVEGARPVERRYYAELHRLGLVVDKPLPYGPLPLMLLLAQVEAQMPEGHTTAELQSEVESRLDRKGVAREIAAWFVFVRDGVAPFSPLAPQGML